MGLLQILILSLGLSMDTLAIAAAIGIGYRPITVWTVFRISFHFALFQAGLFVLGWHMGGFLDRYLASYDHWIAAALLWLIGGHMVWEWWENKTESYSSDPSRGLSLVVLSVATSIDALAVGASVGLLGVALRQPAVILAAMTAILAIAGLELGRRLGSLLRRWGLFGGGITLIVLGIKTLVQHLSS